MKEKILSALKESLIDACFCLVFAVVVYFFFYYFLFFTS